MAYFGIGITAPEFSRYDAYRRILSKQVVAGILLTGQYANGCYQFKYMETDVMKVIPIRVKSGVLMQSYREMQR